MISTFLREVSNFKRKMQIIIRFITRTLFSNFNRDSTMKLTTKDDNFSEL